ncbi:MAG: putative Fe-S protein YdhL (DUF1289 family) [Colwellia sp.]|jgi:predicted Fe-S protein YdhL (DUF1289 family)
MIEDENTIEVSSPCVRNCCLNAEDICIGCFRHINEILAWTNYKTDEKRVVVTTCIKRRASAEEKKYQGKS